MLTAFYDCKDHWTYHTKLDGEQKLNNLCLGLLGGSNPEFLREALPEAAIGSGLTRRMVLVYTSGRSEPVPYPQMNKGLFPSLIHHLNKISQLNGSFLVTNDTMEVYGEEYTRFCKESKLWKDPMTASYAGCARTSHVWKVAMAVAMARKWTLVIEPQDFIDAVHLLEQQEKNLPQLLRSLTMSEIGKHMEWVKSLVRGGVKTRLELLKICSNKLTNYDLDIILDTLDSGGFIKRTVTAGEMFIDKGSNIEF
jgi:hypothetical protein